MHSESTILPSVGQDLLNWPSRIAKQRVRVMVTISGDPLSKQRPRATISERSGRIHVYTPPHTVEAEERIKWHILQTHRQIIPDDGSAFSVRIYFYTKNYQRRDLDNMTKLIFDACNGLVWKDDAQVNEMAARVFRADANPRTELVISTLDFPVRPMLKCRICAKQFRTYPSWPHREYCSAKCAGIGSRTGSKQSPG